MNLILTPILRTKKSMLLLNSKKRGVCKQLKRERAAQPSLMTEEAQPQPDFQQQSSSEQQEQQQVANNHTENDEKRGQKRAKPDRSVQNQQPRPTNRPIGKKMMRFTKNDEAT